MVWITFSGIKSKDYGYKFTTIEWKCQNPCRNI